MVGVARGRSRMTRRKGRVVWASMGPQRCSPKTVHAPNKYSHVARLRSRVKPPEMSATGGAAVARSSSSS